MRLTNNILRNRADLYHKVSNVNASTGASFTGANTEYPTPYATNVRCSVQPEVTQGGIHREFQTGTTDWAVFFGGPPGPLPDDLIVAPDDDGTTKYLVVSQVSNLAGRGSVWKVTCRERVS